MKHHSTVNEPTDHKPNESSLIKQNNCIKPFEEKQTTQSENNKNQKSKPQQMYESEKEQQLTTIDLENPYPCSSSLEDEGCIQNGFNNTFSNTCREKILWSRRTTLVCVMVAISTSLLIALYPSPQIDLNPARVIPVDHSRGDVEDESDISIGSVYNLSTPVLNDQKAPANNTEPVIFLERTGMPKLYRNTTKTKNTDENGVEDKADDVYEIEKQRQNETENYYENESDTNSESDENYFIDEDDSIDLVENNNL